MYHYFTGGIEKCVRIFWGQCKHATLYVIQFTFSLPKIAFLQRCKILLKRFKISPSLLLDGVISAIWLLRVGW